MTLPNRAVWHIILSMNICNQRPVMPFRLDKGTGKRSWNIAASNVFLLIGKRPCDIVTALKANVLPDPYFQSKANHSLHYRNRNIFQSGVCKCIHIYHLLTNSRKVEPLCCQASIRYDCKRMLKQDSNPSTSWRINHKVPTEAFLQIIGHNIAFVISELRRAHQIFQSNVKHCISQIFDLFGIS